MNKSSVDTKVRFYPDGSAEVSGGNLDEMMRIGAALAKNIYGRSKAAAPETPLVNVVADTPDLPMQSTKPVAKEPNGYAPFLDYVPFIDDSVSQHHSAIAALEEYINRSPPDTEFHLKELRRFVGHQITGVWRECENRSTGYLMSRLVGRGIVLRISSGKWRRIKKGH